MYKVTARLFKNNQLVGYTLDDGTSQRDITRNIVWELAKSHQIMNVKATGTIEDMTLSGINGFELKSLPQRIFGEPVKKEEEFKPTVYDLAAHITRGFLSKEYKSMEAGGIVSGYYKANLAKEVVDGTINNYNRCRLSNSIEVIAILKDSFALKPSFGKGEVKNISVEEQLKKSYSCKIVGYRIKNIGTEPIEIIRMTINGELEQGILLKANDEINISMAELMVLGSRIEFSNCFYNAKVSMKFAKSTTIYNCLDNAEYVSNEYCRGELNSVIFRNFKCIDIRKYESPDVIKKYFAKCDDDGSKKPKTQVSIDDMMREYVQNLLAEEQKNGKTESDKPKTQYKIDDEKKRDMIKSLEKEGLFKGFKR